MSPAAGARGTASPTVAERTTLELEPGTLLFGDLHLDLDRQDLAEEFGAWLDGLEGVPRLVILGDFFEYWFGSAQARSPGGRAVLGALARLTGRGTAVELVPGNRDFLLDAAFERETGVRLHPQGFVAQLPDGGRLLVVHGDELCTLDVGYLKLRRVLRSGPVHLASAWMPAFLGRAIARRLRRASRDALANKPKAEAEQQPDAVRGLAAEVGAGGVVCGHAHAFRDERLADGPRWLVVDAFGGERDLLRVEPSGDLVPLPSSSLVPPR